MEPKNSAINFNPIS